MDSLNVPVPGRVERVVSDLAPLLAPFDAIRDRHTLVVKRFPGSGAGLRHEVRRALAGTPAFEVRVTGIDAFDAPARGSGPVVYLAVESPGLVALHERLCREFGSVEGIEGDEYVPHVTLARGGPAEAVDRLRARSIEPITWTVSRLVFWDATYGEPVGRVTLPA